MNGTERIEPGAPPVLSTEEREHVPGWLLRLVDGTDRQAIDYAERHCADRYFRAALRRRLEQLDVKDAR